MSARKSGGVQALLIRQVRAIGRTLFGKILFGIVALHLVVGLVLVASISGP